MTGSQALAAAVARLRDARVPDAPRDARRLLAHALGIAPGRLTLVLPEPLAPAAAARLDQALARRCAREPVSHITGTRAFYGRDFRVTPDVLDPRPETETLIAAALAAPFQTVLDLGTGSGCILLSLLAERPGSAGLGVDISADALAVARDNAARLGIETARFLQSDWFADVTGRFDLVVSNPPYIAAAEMPALAPELSHEPQAALSDGADGLTAYRAIAAGAGRVLAPGGRLLVEIGATQAADVQAILAAVGLDIVAMHPDLDNRDRVVEARLTVREA
ncbi:peptide chain release factor N(5)-glutamine methyltransferase [Rhodovulum adriaticum]|uniref:Release factor glutamine methyltransferase n=1 Tax=Rhodovulum adriaticum TaxID=35804 RepID=A0A4R2NN88_RHOAD|nr:peptide chain release factor N(5)-glutamine methyltransferase [Rhodovulum adriaticum]MBK1634510.1 protein-(glutamine-N5) methyltransferase, release factor-specific [Rhodovulum adriaticum]TCP23120.1 [protein release factor]-glutamine N5-methyltransferase [Rhodovulum adriaticum]